MKLFSIRDRAAGLFGAPFQAPNAALAVRQFQQVQLDNEHVFATHAEDFEIYELGEFVQEDGSFNLLAYPERIPMPLPKKGDA